jgi:hypothetical protein
MVSDEPSATTPSTVTDIPAPSQSACLTGPTAKIVDPNGTKVKRKIYTLRKELVASPIGLCSVFSSWLPAASYCNA